MALSAGTVTVADDGTASGGGLARAIYDAQIAAFSSYFPSAPIGQKRGFASFCNATASAIVSYLTANAAITVTVHTTDSGLQQVALVDTSGPATNKTLSGTLA